jgi:NAD(P)-dependent dehydrogenase (short-subunit alcohol dehydrogenase family)
MDLGTLPQGAVGMSDRDLEGRVAVITGGARGIGKAIAQAFLQAGATVVLGDIQEGSASAVAAELAPLGLVGAGYLDVRNWDSVSSFFSGVRQRHGRVDIGVNNAGATAIDSSLAMTKDSWDEVLAVNLSGVFACAQAEGRIMAEQRSGSIINMASAAAVLAVPERAPYCATKGAIISLTKVLAVEWAPLGIRVNAIGPGWVKTAFVQKAIDDGKLAEDDIRRRTPLRRLARPEEIAQTALYLASDRSSYTTGQTIFPDGGFTSYGGW